MTGFILAVHDISPDIQKYEIIDDQLTEFQAALENKKPVQNFNEMEAKYHQVSDIIRDLSLSRLPLTTLNLKSFLQTLQKKTGHGDIRINIFNDHWNTRILADAYSFSRALVFLFKNLSQLSSQKEFNLAISHPAGSIKFEISWDDSCLLADVEKIMHQRINALPGFGYVLKFNNAKITFLSP
ncbi:MAG: hypothetical protein GY857_16725, partial [Desulfobacula sp.]|nr:hypothetical protein [Desulfobacula sp.]